LIDQLLFALEWNWDDNGLNFSGSWGENETFVIAMLHNHDADRSGGETPTGLPYKLLFLLFILKFDTKHFGEILAQIMTGRSLNGAPIFINPSFNS
jgi:hypothetical protein